MKQTRRYWGGCNADIPYVVVDLPDMRHPNYGPTSYVNLPVDRDGDTPTHWTVTFETLDPAHSFATKSAIMYSGRYRQDGTKLDGLYITASPGTYVKRVYAQYNFRLCTLSGGVPGGIQYVRFVNPLTNDPGVAVPGQMKVWFWSETRRVYFGGADVNTPMQTVSIADLRTTHYTGFDVPRADTSGPINYLYGIELDNPADRFSSGYYLVYTLVGKPDGSTRTGQYQILADGLKVGNYYTTVSFNFAHVSGRVYPTEGLNLQFRLPNVPDPGRAVPGTAKFWAWVE